jgi:predicted amidohydrolase YtcJ
MAGSTKGPADAVYVNGDVVTVDERRPAAEAVAVARGRIVAVGSTAEVLALVGPETRVVDLDGRTLAPGFVDGHGHITQVAAEIDWADLQPPPAGGIGCVDDIVSALRRRRSELAFPHRHILGAGYDDSMLDEGRHPTKEDLDRVSTEHPVWVVHVSRHMAVGNSLALAQAGIEAATPDPEGGVIARHPGTREPTGLLEETAWQHVKMTLVPPVAEHRYAELMRRAGQRYARYGITTAQDGGTDLAGMNMLVGAAREEALPIDVIAYALYPFEDRLRAGSEPYEGRRYRDRLRVAGAKIILDGSPQGKTAWLSRPYLIPPPGEGPDYAGFPFIPDDAAVADLCARCFRAGRQLIAHANGDAAAEQMIEAVARADRELGRADRRPVMIHAQTVRDDQLDRMRALGIVPSFFPAHCFFWGDWHVASVLGRERAFRMNPAQSARRRGMRFSIHNDAPVVPPNVLFLMWNAVTRLSRAGEVIGPAERLTPLEALRAVTIDAAYQCFEEAEKGSIEVGKLADLVVLSANPLRVAPDAIKDIEVLATLKEGVPVYVSGALDLVAHPVSAPL